MTDRAALLLEDVLAGPAALARAIDAYADRAGPLSRAGSPPARVVMTGLGSSRYAALALEASFRACGIAVHVEYASTAEPTAPAEDLVLIAISAGGGTREVVEAGRRHRGLSRVIAVSNGEDSPLAREADVVLPLYAGEEQSGVATRTFRGTLAVLGMLAHHWQAGSGGVREVLGPCVDALSRVLDARDAWLDEACDRLDGAPAIDVLADASELGLAEQAALMLREGPRLPAAARDTGDWLHTAVYLAFPGHRAILFSGASSDREVVETIARRGGESIVVGAAVEGAVQTIGIETEGGRLGRLGRSIVGSVVGELLSAELWRRTSGTDKGT